MRRIALLLAAAPLLYAESFDAQLQKEIHTIQGYCNGMPKFDLPLITQCGQAIFNGSPLHPELQPFAPGNGIGIGLGYKHQFTFGEKWKNDIGIGGLGSFQGAWKGYLLTTFRLQRDTPTLNGPPVNPLHQVKDSLLVHFFIEGQGLPQIDYYGQGPHSSLNSLVKYSERDVRIGMAVDKPLTWWLNAGAKIEGLWPDIGLPAIGSQPIFIHYQAFLRPHFPNQEPYDLLYKIGYEFYQATGGQQYSFRRFRADLLHNLYLERSNGVKRRDSILSFYGRLSLADASKNNIVPFYLQETLGGTDINGDPALRGFPDYRFRANNLVAIETEFNRRIWKFLGLMAFYDVGQVAQRRGDLDIGGFRHSVGGGFTFWSASRVVLKAYVGFGGGEGHHTFTGILPTPGPVNTPYRSF